VSREPEPAGVRQPPLPSFGLGAAQLGNLFRAISDEAAADTVDAAWRAGIRYFDTAPHYGLGLSEHRLGAALARYPRHEYLVSTKVGRRLEPRRDTANHQDALGFAVPASLQRVWDFSPDGIRRTLEASLTRLGLDSVDIVYLHDPDDHWSVASTTGIDTLVGLRDEGVVSAIGVAMNQSAMPAHFVRRYDIDVVMLAGRFTLLDQRALDDLLPAALDRRVRVVAAGVYNSGLLSEPTPRAGAMYDYRPAQVELLDRARRLAVVCEAHGVDLPTAALQFPRLHPGVTSVLVGAESAQQVQVNVARWATTVPDALWPELISDGLVRPFVAART
jgi:D-threo-aldose 1-dehydrogenase